MALHDLLAMAGTQPGAAGAGGAGLIQAVKFLKDIGQLLSGISGPRCARRSPRSLRRPWPPGPPGRRNTVAHGVAQDVVEHPGQLVRVPRTTSREAMSVRQVRSFPAKAE